MDVPIIADNITESSESFTGNLDTGAPRVTLNPDETIITISDDDGPCKLDIPLSPPITVQTELVEVFYPL